MPAASHDTILINSSFYFIRNPTFLAAENRDFGRFVTTWYNVHCKRTRFFEFLGLLTSFLLSEEAWFCGVRVEFGGFGVAKVRLPAH